MPEFQSIKQIIGSLRRPTATGLTEHVQQCREGNLTRSDSLRQLRRAWVLEVLSAHHGNQCRAAAELGMHRNTLLREIQELRLAGDVERIRGESDWCRWRKVPASAAVTTAKRERA